MCACMRARVCVTLKALENHQRDRIGETVLRGELLELSSILIHLAQFLFFSSLAEPWAPADKEAPNHARLRNVKLSVPEEVRVEGQSSEKLATMREGGYILRFL